ncbi:hypothetical protein BD779DRAFT_1689909 [Infundibulicybe gibba]|nr:hypothetical protein BD779DRAFT_1689909 [Infundibulicybe gibba]
MGTRTITLDASPPIHRDMRDALDKGLFHKSLSVLAAQVPPPKTGIMLRSQVMKQSLMNLPKIRSVVPNPSDPEGDRLMLLRVQDESELSAEILEFLKTEAKGLVKYQLDLDYDYWTADEILQAILPEDLCEGSPTGFAMTGHIAHVNLNDEYLPYKHIIGQVILDKNKRVQTVVNKLDSIDSQFRFFKMELIAGEPNYIVEHHESDCRFTFDFTHVYWNSRLHTEHQRLVECFSPHDVVADVFAGVGPFALPAAKKGCAVLANDLNPESVKWLRVNVKENRVSDLVRVSCEDGREFIRSVVTRAYDEPFPAYTGPRPSRMQEREADKRRRRLGSPTPPDSNTAPTQQLPPRTRIAHFVMNLPDSAIQFLDAFRGALVDKSADRDLRGLYADALPMIHCHCFTRELEPEKAEEDIRKRVEDKLGCALSEDVTFHLVRSVAPNKEMYCISFRLPSEAAFASVES